MSAPVGEVETSFIPASSSRGKADHSSSLYVQNESVAQYSNRNGGDTEESPLLSSRSQSRSRRTRAKLCTMSLLISTCVLAGFVALISITLLAEFPETLQRNSQRILPNDTILAVPETGLDPTIINYVVYRYYHEQESLSEMDTLFLYREKCDDLKSLIKTRMVDLNYSWTLPREDVDIVILDNQYLLNGSNIKYHINLTISPPGAANYCYEITHVVDEEVDKICNTSTATFTLSAAKDSYAQVVLSVVKREANFQIQSINVQANGTVYYFDVSPSRDHLVCQLSPPVQTSCLIPIYSVKEIGSHKNRVCILAQRETSIDKLESSDFEYDIASFSYAQVILVTFICIGLVSFVCMLGLSISCCTKQGRKLRAALRMSDVN